MRFELIGECAAVNLVVAYAPTEANPNGELKKVFWKKLGHLVKQIPTQELLFVLIDANARTGKRMTGCDDGRVLGAYGRDLFYFIFFHPIYYLRPSVLPPS